MQTILEHRQQRYCLRTMALSDLDSIMAIEEQAQLHPWGRSSMLASLESDHQCWVLEILNSPSAEQAPSKQESLGIVAYAITSTVVDEAELLNITVAPPFQRKGIGRLLLEFLARSFSPSIQTLFLEVRVSNHAAIAMYHSLYFNEVGTRPNYYPAKKGREDALIMALLL